jgi:succinate dehydrogenase / fumarate reductase cytochrome b subunit
LSWLTAALRSTVGQKFVMGITGLFLCSFLVIHLAGNMLLYVGADAYNAYAHALHKNVVLLVGAEIFLYAAFAAHIYLAFVTTRDNWAARDSRYAVKQTKIEHRTIDVAGYNASNTMFLTGSVILLFLILHLADFKFEIGWSDVEDQEPFDKAAAIMSNSARMIAYAIGCVFLGIHVSHGFASCFQSLGINPPRYRRCIEVTSWIFGIVVAVGFGSFVLWGMGQSDDGGPPREAINRPAATVTDH